MDQTLHWANPPGGTTGRDMRPSFTATPGPVHRARSRWSRTCTARWASATRATATPRPGTCPAAGNIPDGYATRGTWYDFFAGKAGDGYGATWGPGYATFQYPNENRASTIWYHDHTLGMTRLNVYAGPAGFYLIRGGPAGDNAVLDGRTGTAGRAAGPGPQGGRQVPVQQDLLRNPDRRSRTAPFNADGSLFYPDSRLFFDGIAGPYIPDTRRVADLEPRVPRQHDLWSTGRRGRTLRSSRGATRSVSSTAATRGS